jgi:hypothetical protein
MKMCRKHNKKLIAALSVALMLSGCSTGATTGSARDGQTQNVPGNETVASEIDPENAEEQIPAGPTPEELEAIANEEADAWIKEHHIWVPAEYADISHSDLRNVDIDRIISRLPNIKRLVMCDCGLTNDEYAAIQDRHPDIKIVWEIQLSHWTIRTDVVAFSTFKTTADEFYLDNDEAYYLKYCDELVALDLGHNYVSDLSFLEYMPNLKILILVDNVKCKEGETLRHLTDLSDVRYCTKLRYLEIFANNVSDFSFMENLTELEDLNISYNSVSSIEYMRNLPNLKRLWMENTYIPYSSYLSLRQMYPNAQIIYSGEGSVDQGWRSGPRYYAMRRMFRDNYIDEIYRD